MAPLEMVKYLPVMPETRVGSRSQENPLERGMATHSSILAWRINPDILDSYVLIISPWSNFIGICNAG